MEIGTSLLNLCKTGDADFTTKWEPYKSRYKIMSRSSGSYIVSKFEGIFYGKLLPAFERVKS